MCVAQAKTEQQLLESEGEQSSLRRLLKLKNQELANIRKLAQEVLSHRSDVENFLLSSIYQVRPGVVESLLLASTTIQQPP